MKGIARGLVEVSYDRNQYRGRILRDGEEVCVGTRVLSLRDAITETNALERLVTGRKW